MTPKEKAQLYHNIWCCAYQRRYNAKVAGDWDRYDREHTTILMCLHIADWAKFDTDQFRHLKTV